MNFDELKIFVENFRIISDEPLIGPDSFRFSSYATQMQEFLVDDKLTTPFVVGIDGVWGSGKTTLMKNIKKEIEGYLRKPENSNKPIHLVWFDAWKFEKYDPVLALYHHLLTSLGDNPELKKKIGKMAILTSDVFARKFLGISIKEIKNDLEEIQGHYGDMINDLRDQFSKTLEKSIEKDGRVIIFIDDLDRCENQNILSILGNIKQVLNIKKLIFVLGIDMEKIERAWALDHKGGPLSLNEGKEHVDKLFQLKIKVPFKRYSDFLGFVKRQCPNLPQKEANLFARGVRRNPRKFQHAINLYYFILKSYYKQIGNSEKEESDLKDKLSAITASAILHAAHPDIMKATLGNFTDLLKAAKIIWIIDRYSELKKQLRVAEEVFRGSVKTKTSLDDPFFKGPEGKQEMTPEYLTPIFMDLLRIANNDWQSFHFLKALAKYLDLPHRDGYRQLGLLIADATHSIPMVSFYGENYLDYGPSS